jgi:hypothetical protein
MHKKGKMAGYLQLDKDIPPDWNPGTEQRLLMFK